MTLEQARRNMVTQQLRTWFVSEPHLPHPYIEHLPRDAFLPNAYRKVAYADIRLPLGHGQIILPPKEEARMIAALEIQPTDKILEIGTGSATALPSWLALDEK